MVLSKLKKIEVDIIVLLIAVYAFLIPFNQVVTTIFLIFVLIFSLLKFKKSNVVINKSLLLPIALYLLLILSFLWSSSVNYKYIQRFSQLIFIAVLFIINGKKLIDQNKEFILKAFIIGSTVSVLYCEIYSTYRAAVFYPGGFHAVVQPGHSLLQSMSDGGNLYFGKYFSTFHDPIYYSSFLILAFFSLVYLPFKKKIINIFLGLVLIIGIFQISNRSSLLILILLTFVFLLNKLKNNKSVKLKAISFISFLFFTFLIFLNPRLNKMLNSIYTSGITINPEANTTYEVRVLVWDAAIKLIKKSPVLGYGVSGHSNALYKFYKENNYSGPLAAKLNSHNQYFTTTLETGVLGLIILVTMLYFIFFNKNQNYFLLKKISQTFCIILIISFLFESMLQRYSGILFFCFFYCLFSSGPKSISNIKS